MDQQFILLDRTKGLEEIINFGMFPFASGIQQLLKIALVQDEYACSVQQRSDSYISCNFLSKS